MLVGALSLHMMKPICPDGYLKETPDDRLVDRETRSNLGISAVEVVELDQTRKMV